MGAKKDKTAAQGKVVAVVYMTMKRSTFESFCSSPTWPVPGKPDQVTVRVPQETTLELNTALQGGIRGQIYTGKKKKKGKKAQAKPLVQATPKPLN